MRDVVAVLAQRDADAAVAESHALGLKVLPWTVNDPRDMARLIDHSASTGSSPTIRTGLAG